MLAELRCESSSAILPQVAHDLLHNLLGHGHQHPPLYFIFKVIRLHPSRKAHLEQDFSSHKYFLEAKSETNNVYFTFWILSILNWNIFCQFICNSSLKCKF